MKIKNLKFRIKRVILLSIFFSILFFTLIISYSSLKSEREQAFLLSSMISNMASKEIFSNEILDSLNLDSFSNPLARPYYVGMIVNRIKSFEEKTLRTVSDPSNVAKTFIMEQGNSFGDVLGKKKLVDHIFTNGFFQMGQIVQVKVTIEGDNIYESRYWGNSIYLNTFRGKLIYPFVKAMTELLKVESINHVALSGDGTVHDATGKPFATIAVRMDPGFMVAEYNVILFGILLSAAIALAFSFLIAHIMARGISKPLSLMVSKLRSLALEDYETTLHSQILVKKRALQEIQSIAGSTNTIISKMNQYSNMQLNQTSLLEKQRSELEAQKEELLESRHTIQEAQTQLVQSQNLASIGQLTAAISHEINQPLDNIRNGVERLNDSVAYLLAHEKIQANPEARDLINQLKEAGSLNMTAFSRISSIIRSLENFSRLDQSQMEMACINENVRSVVLLTSNLWKRRINMVEEYGELPVVYCYAGLINQVFMNIVVNAIHAIPDKGDIIIKTWSDEDFVYISIRDTGTGIPDHILPHIFETGFTTKKCGKGSGLGLSICRDIMKKHNGKIDVKSKEGEGSEFTIVLPYKREA